MDTRLPDTPWHIGYIKKDEEDPRRHKKRCVFNENNHCKNSHLNGECYGSSHCKYYAEDWETAEKYENSMKIRIRTDAGKIAVNVKKILLDLENINKQSIEKDEKIIEPTSNKNNDFSTEPYILHKKKKKLSKTNSNKTNNSSTKPYTSHKKKRKSKKIKNKVVKEKISICYSCRNFNKEICTISNTNRGLVLHCLFFKL